MSVMSGPLVAQVIRYTRRCKQNADAETMHRRRQGPWIDITPLDDPDAAAGPNSVDVHLSRYLRVYAVDTRVGPDGHLERCLDMKKDNPTLDVDIPPDGLVLRPGVLYLGATAERTECAGVVPWLDGRSSVGRLGMQIHATAGRGDDGFGMDRPGGCPWTLEITVAMPLRVYAGARVGQLTFFYLKGDRKPYTGKYGAQDGPVSSQMWRDFAAPAFGDTVLNPGDETS